MGEQKRILYTGGFLLVVSIIVLLTANVAVTQTENMTNENQGPSQPLPLPPINIQQIQQQQQQQQQPQQPSSTVVKSTHPILFDEKGNFAGGSDSAFILGLAPTAGTLKNLTAFVGLPPGVGKTATITVDKNFVKTPLTCNITGNLQLCFDNVHSVTVAQGDFISVEIALSPDAQGSAEFGGGLGFQEN